MAEIPEDLRTFLLGASLALLFAYAWVSLKPAPLMARILARLCLVALAVFPMVLMVLLHQERVATSTGAGAPPVVAEAPRDPAPVPAPPSLPRSTEPGGESRGLGGAATGSGGSSPPGSPPIVSAPEPPKAAAPVPADDELALREPEPAPEALPPADDETDISEPPPVGAAADDSKAYDVVPVFFGTDRSEVPATPRVGYGPVRGRKLILGQALVTVPKSHEVPKIERPWAIRIPYLDITLFEQAEDPARHFTMKELKSLTREEFLQLVRERLSKSSAFKDHALVFIHGFNTTFDNGVYRTAQIAYDLKFDGAPFLYSWPSGGGVASYTYDRESAGQSVPFMREFLELVVEQTGARSVSVIAHSMGNQPALQVLKDIRASSPAGVVINQIILAAPDVDRDNFENIAREISGLANGITLYAAANDRALGISRRFHGGVPRAGDVPSGGPLVVPGVDTIDVTAVSTDSLGLNHSGYAENNALLEDLQRLIQTGERPPERRIPNLERIGSDEGTYWRFPPPR